MVYFSLFFLKFYLYLSIGEIEFCLVVLLFIWLFIKVVIVNMKTRLRQRPS